MTVPGAAGLETTGGAVPGGRYIGCPACGCAVVVVVAMLPTAYRTESMVNLLRPRPS